MIYEENSTNIDGNWAIININPMMKEEKKVEKPITNVKKLGEKECQYCKKSNHKKKCFWNPNNWKNKLKQNKR
jgi:hypothetical protein